MSRRLQNLSLSTMMLWLGMFFLYAPMFVLVIYSFNESKLVTVLGGVSAKWYGELFKDDQILDAVWMSLRVAFFASTMAVLLGTMAALVMTRFKRVIVKSGV